MIQSLIIEVDGPCPGAAMRLGGGDRFVAVDLPESVSWAPAQEGV